jgi:hypothetical protein
MMCISRHESLVLLALIQSIPNQQGLHSPAVSEQVVSLSHVSIQTTSGSSRALQFGSSGVPHPIVHVPLQSGYHASNSAQWNTVHRRHAFPSLSHPLDRQAHLKTATFFETTSHRVNGNMALQ